MSRLSCQSGCFWGVSRVAVFRPEASRWGASRFEACSKPGRNAFTLALYLERMKSFCWIGLGWVGLAIALQACQPMLGWDLGWEPTGSRSPNEAIAPPENLPVEVISLKLRPLELPPDGSAPVAAPTPTQIPPMPAPLRPAPSHQAANLQAANLQAANLQAVNLQYQVFELATSTVHLLRIPPQSPVKLTIALATDLAPVPDLARTVPGAIAAINAGFFDPNNAHSMNFITQNGIKTGDPTQNQRLMQNAGIQPYLTQVLNRSEFRRYRCEADSSNPAPGESAGDRYAITFHNAPIPAGCTLSDAVGGGPQLLPRLTATEEAFWAEAQGQVVRDAIGLKRPNARSAIALTSQGEILLALVAQKPWPAPSPLWPSRSTPAQPPKPTPSGLSLPELAAFLREQGAVQALNLDGGSSSALYYAPPNLAPQTLYGKRDEQGQVIQRSVKSVIVVSPQ